MALLIRYTLALLWMRCDVCLINSVHNVRRRTYLQPQLACPDMFKGAEINWNKLTCVCIDTNVIFNLNRSDSLLLKLKSNLNVTAARSQLWCHNFLLWLHWPLSLNTNVPIRLAPFARVLLPRNRASATALSSSVLTWFELGRREGLLHISRCNYVTLPPPPVFDDVTCSM